MNEIQLHRVDLNLLVVFEVLMDEQSVSLAARRLFKTPSAISHSLSRLREQTGDPLMVMVAGRMQPSPYALRLIEDVRPILQSVRRAMQRDAAFDPTASHRMFRVPDREPAARRPHADRRGAGLSSPDGRLHPDP
jgi:DNA-binding transcriptional LysR family regulator